MKRLLNTYLIICLAVVPLLNTGCAYYVGKNHPTVSYNELQHTAKTPLLLNFKYLANGEYNKNLTKSHKVKFMLILKESGLFSSVTFVGDQGSTSAPRLDLVLNETFDTKSTFVKGLITGLTFFIVGSNVTYNYEFEGTYTRPGMTKVSYNYKHDLYMAKGLIVSKTDGIARHSCESAVDHIAMDLTVHLLRDLQQAGHL
jgi:hypothetical protein